MATARKNVLEEEWMTLVEASRVLGETRLKVLSRSVKGELEAQHLAGRTLIRRSSVDALLATRP
jgi:hypothetical protein